MLDDPSAMSSATSSGSRCRRRLTDDPPAMSFAAGAATTRHPDNEPGPSAEEERDPVSDEATIRPPRAASKWALSPGWCPNRRESPVIRGDTATARTPPFGFHSWFRAVGLRLVRQA